MIYVAWIAVTYLLLALLSPLLGRLDVQLYAPDVALLTSLFVGSRSPLGAAVATAFAVGLLKDGYSLSAPVGVYTEINVLVALLARLLHNRVDLVSPVPVIATSAATSLLATALFLAFESVFHRSFSAHSEVLATALPLALTTMLVAPAQFKLLDAVGRQFERSDRGAVLLRR